MTESTTLERQIRLPLVLCIALTCASCGGRSSSQSYPASSAGTRDGAYMICYTESNAHGVTVSQVFHIPAVDQVTMLEEPWAKDFRRYVGESGDRGGISVACTEVDPAHPDDALKDQIAAWRKQGITVTQVKWKYAG